MGAREFRRIGRDGKTRDAVKAARGKLLATTARRAKDRAPLKLIDRYVGWQVLLISTIAVAVLSVVLVLGNIFKRLLEFLMRNDASGEQVLTFLSYILPFSMIFTIPWGFLTAVLLVFGKMSAENELIALRATGVSIPRVTLPVLVLSMFSVGACLWINLDVAPRAQWQAKEALYNMAVSNPLAMFDSDKVIEAFPGRKIYVERNEGAELFNLFVYEMDDDFLPVKVIFASRGKLETDRAHKEILLHLFDTRYEQRDSADPQNLRKIQPATWQQNTLKISLEELSEKRRGKGVGSLSAKELLDRLNADQQNAGTTDKAQREALSSARTEISKRFAWGMASFAFALIGVPLAITAHRKETSVGFLLSLAIGVTYFVLSVTIYDHRANERLHPEMLIWMPNLLCIGLGGWLFFRMSRR